MYLTVLTTDSNFVTVEFTEQYKKILYQNRESTLQFFNSNENAHSIMFYDDSISLRDRSLVNINFKFKGINYLQFTEEPLFPLDHGDNISIGCSFCMIESHLFSYNILDKVSTEYKTLHILWSDVLDKNLNWKV